MATRTPKTTTKKATAVPTLDPRVFNYPVNEALLNQVIHVYRANTHQNTSQVKTRGEVNRTTKKVYRQKGTGNARHGARSAPIYVGGGVAHGPSGVSPALKKVNRKMKAAALAGVLSLYAKDKRLDLVTAPEINKPKTKAVISLFGKKKTLLVYHSDTAPFIQSVKNLDSVSLVEAGKLNPYSVSLHQHLALTPSAHEAIVKRLLPLLKAPAKQDLASPDKK